MDAVCMEGGDTAGILWPDGDVKRAAAYDELSRGAVPVGVRVSLDHV